MCASRSFNQFQPDPDNEEITNLQKNVGSLEKRLDEIEKLKSTSDAFMMIQILQDDINKLQRQIDNASRSGRKDITNLVEQFNGLKRSITNQVKQLQQKIDSVDNRLQANTDDDNKTKCFMHLDAHRCQAAAEIADRMSSNAVIEIIRMYCSPDNQQKADRNKVLFEFLHNMKNQEPRIRCQPELNAIRKYEFHFKE